MSQIKTIKAREILDSRGNPTIEAEVILTTGECGRASVPSGASTGTNEAIEKRDANPKRFLGKGVLEAIVIIQKDLAQALKGFDVTHQQEIDEVMLELDGTTNKAKLGANAILAVSIAVAKAAALFKQLPLYAYFYQRSQYILPVPMMNIINGGAHADNNLDFQEFMIMPIGASIFQDALRAGTEVFHHLKNLLKAKNYNTNVGDEGGFAPNLPSHAAACELILEAIHKAGYHSEKDICLSIDVASSEFYHSGRYHLKGENLNLSADELIAYLNNLVRQYPIKSIEDGMAENDWQGWQQLTESLGKEVQLVGDDIFVTNTSILKRGIEEKVANAILIKPNQIGTLSETFAAIQMAQLANYNTIISHRSGETEDTTIADLAVAMNAGQIKTGSLCRTDRVSKYNQLLRIAEQLGNRGQYAGHQIFKKFITPQNVQTMKQASGN